MPAISRTGVYEEGTHCACICLLRTYLYEDIYTYVSIFVYMHSSTYSEYTALVRPIAYDQARQGLFHVDFGHLAGG